MGNMTNAKKELMLTLDDIEQQIKCAWIQCGNINLQLKVNYTIDEYNEFINKMDFEYDSSWGSQHLYGIVWLKDNNSWLERGEYDGSEWWDYKYLPNIPDNLK